MAKTQQSFARHAKYKGPKAIFDGEEVGFVKAHYALDADGKNLLLRGGKPVRLIQVDLAPDDPDDGREEYLIAGEKDPPQIDKGRLVQLEPENIHVKGGIDA
jgi:hypothetical protein